MNDRSSRRHGGDQPKRVPSALGDVLSKVLAEHGIAERVAQAAVIPEWPRIVGPQIAAVTAPILLQQDGTLVVAVSTNAWMTELSLLEPELMQQLNADPTRPPIARLRWMLRR